MNKKKVDIESSEPINRAAEVDEPGGLVPVLTEPPSCGSFFIIRWKNEEGRWKKEDMSTGMVLHK